VLTNHDEIRQWAEERNAQPASVRGTGNNTGPSEIGMIRLDFPGYSGEQSLEPIEWEEWFEVFDDRGLALLVQDETSGGQRSNFNKLVSRETATASSSSSSSSRKKSSSRSSGRSRRAA
jgi:alkylation response protein AidB-like acyl-CoA dehydrogenase